MANVAYSNAIPEALKNSSGQFISPIVSENSVFTSDGADGETISSKYIKQLSVNGKVITYTKGNGTTGTITTQDTKVEWTII